MKTTIIKAKILTVHDGDTCTVITTTTQEKFKIRFAFIDAPEASDNVGYQPLADEATAELQKLLPVDSEVTLLIHSIDLYQRRVAEIVNVNGINVNEYMIQNGFAFWYQKFDKTQNKQIHEQYETEAKNKKLGIWGVSEEDPNVFRHRHDKDETIDPENKRKKVIAYGYGDLHDKSIEDARTEAIKAAKKKMQKVAEYKIIDEGIEDKYNYFVKIERTKEK